MALAAPNRIRTLPLGTEDRHLVRERGRWPARPFSRGPRQTRRPGSDVCRWLTRSGVTTRSGPTPSENLHVRSGARKGPGRAGRIRLTDALGQGAVSSRGIRPAGAPRTRFRRGAPCAKMWSWILATSSRNLGTSSRNRRLGRKPLSGSPKRSGRGSAATPRKRSSPASRSTSACDGPKTSNPPRDDPPVAAFTGRRGRPVPETPGTESSRNPAPED